MPGNAVLVNFSGGETSPKSRGRFDAPWYQTSAKKILNFISEMLGPARYRPGFQFIRQTRQGQTPRFIPFQVSNVVSYMLEFTPGYMRAYQQVGNVWDLVTTPTGITITGVTRANPGVVSVAGTTGLANGNEIIITGAVGMPQLNGCQFVIGSINAGAGTFQLLDPVTLTAIDTTAWGAWTSGGTIAIVTEYATPYSAADLPNLQGAAQRTVMYLVCPTQPPQKLTVDGAGNFAIGTFARTNDPFGNGAANTVTKILRTGDSTAGIFTASIIPSSYSPVGAGKTLVILAAGTVLHDNAPYTFAGVVGTTQINGQTYNLKLASEDSQWAGAGFKNPTYVAYVDSSAWTAYTSGGTATAAAEYPISVCFYEGRLVYGGTNIRPDCLFLSRSPDPTTGNSRYDDFTGGSNADNACFFQLAPVTGTTDTISWVRGGSDHLFVGTFGGPFRVSGSGLDIPITPSSINVRQFHEAGCEETMAVGCEQIFYVQRAGPTVRAIQVLNPYLATFQTKDLCENAEQIGYSALQRVVLQHGRPDVLWAYRADGSLVGLSVKYNAQQTETLTGWHRHALGGGGKIVDLGVVQRSAGFDYLFAAVQRTVGGVTRTFFSLLADDVAFPDGEDFFSAGVVNKASDQSNFQNALYRLQEKYCYLDASSAYDGSARGAAAAATITPSAVTGNGITLTASQPVFTAADVGAEVWKKPDPVTGLGGGRATITAYVSATQVTANVTVNFNSTTAIAAGQWYFAITKVYGLPHLAGAVVAVVTDGGVYSDGGISGVSPAYPVVTVGADGSVTLPNPAAFIRIGFAYAGFVETHNLEMGGRSGPAQNKPRTISEMYIRFLNTLGAEYGTNLYTLQRVINRLSDATFDRPAPVFSGSRRLAYQDTSSGLDDATREKSIVIAQRLPLPCIVENIDIYYDTEETPG